MAESGCVPTHEVPCRVNLELMPEGTFVWMLLLTAVAFGIATYGVWEMIAVWRKGKAWEPGDAKAGAKRLIAALATHRKFMKSPSPGTMHSWIFFGFVVLFIGTTLAAIDSDIYEPLGGKLLKGDFYLFYEFTLDAFGILFVLGVLWALKRRIVDRPPELHPTRHVESPAPRSRGDLYALWFLLGIGLTGFLLEGMRIRHQVDTLGISYASWSFVGNLVAQAFSGMEADTMGTVYRVSWWVHFALWTSILAVLPWTKLKHILTSSLNIYYHDEKRQARADLPTPFNLQKMMESGDMDLPEVGYATIRDFTWKDRLALDACTNCGRCEAQCPATAAGRPLSPRKLIQDLKAHMWEDHRAEKAHVRGGGKPAGTVGEDGQVVAEAYQPQRLTMVADGHLATQIDEATLWSCTTCRACMTECPVDIEHVDIIVEMRRAQVMESKLDEHQSRLLVNLTNTGNPYGFSMMDRANWTEGLPDGISIPTAAEKIARGEPIELLWWVGCVGSFDPRNNKVTRDIATILHHADVDVCILGNDEKCNGDPARRLGEEGRFQQSVMENLMVLQEMGVKKILTQCPHCFNTLANEYPGFGAEWEVVHHTQFIEQLIEQERVPLKAGKQMQITFHDSCYLGRHNGIFDAPRRVIEATNGLPVLEMAQTRERGLCCGAGGSNMWFEIGQEKERINVIRAQQVEETGAETVASACPFCLIMMQDGIGLTGQEESVVAKDLAEIVVEHLATGWKEDWQDPDDDGTVAGVMEDATKATVVDGPDAKVEGAKADGPAGGAPEEDSGRI